MPSIIDRITNAEAEAAALKRDAAVKARQAIAEASSEAQRLVAGARDQGREELIEAQARAEEEGQKIAADIRAAKAREADAVCAAAGKNMDAAVGYILERVTQA